MSDLLCGPVTVTKSDGSTEVRPPYTLEELRKIVHREDYVFQLSRRPPGGEREPRGEPDH